MDTNVYLVKARFRQALYARMASDLQKYPFRYRMGYELGVNAALECLEDVLLLEIRKD